MSDFLILLVELFRHYNVLFLGGLIILQNNGVPVGVNFLVIASGALAYGGEFNIWFLAGQIWFFQVLGDSISYWLWRRGGEYLKTKYPRLQIRLEPGLNKTDDYFDKYGKITVLFTRFPLSALCTVANISAGTSEFDYMVFLFYAAMGDFIWVIFNLGAGYWFGDSIEQITPLISQMGILLILVLILGITVYLTIRYIKARRLSS